MEKGNLSINSENILPIIKKWLYSDTDIFIRELVSNGADAINKLKKLATLGEADKSILDEKLQINVVLDKENKKIMIEDNGIGMTADEVKKYINDIAFSGATDFINKYNEGENADAIIGHFGLGFYSAFMVSNVVEIDTLSFKEGSEPVKWVCDGGIEYELKESTKSTRGTTITLNVNDDSLEFLDKFKLTDIIKKYCGFIPVEVYLTDLADEQKETSTDADSSNDESSSEEVAEIKPINDTTPLWTKKPSEVTDEEYIEFYHKVFNDFNDPLFWIHLNMDYPFNLKGILYFPKLKHDLDSIEGQVKLFNNQVFIADNIKEVIPEFLLLLKGVVDCPDLPLNVSRSFLQNDGFVTKLSDYIIKKVGDKLNSIFKSNREEYNKYWDDINQFIKYGCLREKKFYDKVEKSLVFKTTKGEYYTIDEYLENFGDKTDKTIYYTDNLIQHSQYIKLFENKGIDIAILETRLDNPYISFIEGTKGDIKFSRIDSDLSKSSEESNVDENVKNSLIDVFKSALSNDKLEVKVESLPSEEIPAMILISEESRRMQEMSKMFGHMDMFANMQPDESVVLNANNDLVKKLSKTDTIGDCDLLAKYIYDLALISHRQLKPEEMTNFLQRSNELLGKIVIPLSPQLNKSIFTTCR